MLPTRITLVFNHQTRITVYTLQSHMIEHNWNVMQQHLILNAFTLLATLNCKIGLCQWHKCIWHPSVFFLSCFNASAYMNKANWWTNFIIVIYEKRKQRFSSALFPINCYISMPPHKNFNMPKPWPLWCRLCFGRSSNGYRWGYLCRQWGECSIWSL